MNDSEFTPPPELLIAVSTRQDGTMLDRELANRHHETVVANRRAFCGNNGIAYDKCVYQTISYDDEQTYDRIQEVDIPSSEGVYADVLYTRTPDLGLFLPIADCVGTVIYDPIRKALALAHIGRHASIAKTLQKTIRYFVRDGSKTDNIFVWMAPSVGVEDYTMKYFHYTADQDWQPFVDIMPDGIHLDLQGFNKNLALQEGVPERNIFISKTNTARDKKYFSHSQGDTNGRFAVLAMMKKS